MHELILAFLVCFTDCDVHDFPLDKLTPTIQAIAIEREWFNPPERDYSTCYTVNDVNFLRLRRSVYEPMPHTSMVKTLPPLELLQEWRVFNQKHQQRLEDRAELDMINKGLLLFYAKECHRLRTIIDYAIQCHTERSVLMIRQYLEIIREGIGTERFYTGMFPPFVPLNSVPDSQAKN